MDFLGRRAQKGLTPPHTPTGIRGEGRGAIGVSAETARGQDKFQNLENRGEPLENIWSPGTGGGGGHMPRPPPPPYPPGLPPPPPPPTQDFPPGGWVPPGEGGHQVHPPLATGLAARGLSDSSIHAFAAALQGVVAAGVSAALGQNLENRGEHLAKFWSPGTRGGRHMPRPPPPPYPPGLPHPPNPSHTRLTARGVGPTRGRGGSRYRP